MVVGGTPAGGDKSQRSSLSRSIASCAATTSSMKSARRERPKLAARVEVGEEQHHLPIAPHRPAIASSTLAPSPYAD